MGQRTLIFQSIEPPYCFFWTSINDISDFRIPGLSSSSSDQSSLECIADVSFPLIEAMPLQHTCHDTCRVRYGGRVAQALIDGSMEVEPSPVQYRTSRHIRMCAHHTLAVFSGNGYVFIYVSIVATHPPSIELKLLLMASYAADKTHHKSIKINNLKWDCLIAVLALSGKTDPAEGSTGQHHAEEVQSCGPS